MYIYFLLHPVIMQNIHVYFINHYSSHETDYYMCLFPVLYQNATHCEVTFSDMVNMFIIEFAQGIVCLSVLADGLHSKAIVFAHLVINGEVLMMI